MAKEELFTITWGFIVKWSIGLLLFIVLLMFAIPRYKVWQQKMEGLAALEKATQDRQIVTQDALAKKDAAADLAAADTIRAHGVATANKIIGASLHENPEYLKWLWISELEKTKNQIIYIPTETNMPILEAQRLGNTPVEKN